jgi:putative tryptophan/tyrosine transport system substrate-binding protein
MKLKILNFTVGALFFALCMSAFAQQPTKIPRIGYISGTGDASNQGPFVEALRQGMKDLGYVEGTHFIMEFRGAQGNTEAVPRLVAELLQLKVDVLVLPIVSAIRAAKQATKSVPIVIVTQVDPVATGLVDSLAHPGGNITGIATLQRDLSGKRLELVAELVPRLSRIGILWEADESVSAIGFKNYETAASTLKIKLQSLEVRGPTPDLEGIFRDAAKAGSRAVITITNNALFLNSKRIIALAMKHRLPSMYEGSSWVNAGGLMSYSADDIAVFRRAATYVDKLLKGAKPADLPVEQPTKFEFVINLKTAKQIGLDISQSVLFRADKVIR